MSSKFKIGEVVVCIRMVGGVTIGNNYIIKNVFADLEDWNYNIEYEYMIKDDNDMISSYRENVFTDVITYRNSVIDDLLE